MELFKELQLEDQSIVVPLIKKFNTASSEINFTHLYMWRRFNTLRYGVIGGYLWLMNTTEKGEWQFMPPIGDYNEALLDSVNQMIEILRAQGRTLIIRKADDQVREFFSLNYGENICIREVRADYDYLYDFSHLMLLSGKRYHKKKNHMNKFLKTYSNWEYEPIDETNKDDVIEYTNHWFEKFNDGDRYLCHEHRGIIDAINNQSELNFNGGLIRIGGKVKAFTLAEKINHDTTVIHTEKADREINGLYTAINKLYLENCPESTKFVNREEDMGIPGLRKAKKSYHPIGYVRKHEIRFDEECIESRFSRAGTA